MSDKCNKCIHFVQHEEFRKWGKCTDLKSQYSWVDHHVLVNGEQDRECVC